jgi:hypothetical protein
VTVRNPGYGDDPKQNPTARSNDGMLKIDPTFEAPTRTKSPAARGVTTLAYSHMVFVDEFLRHEYARERGYQDAPAS